MIPYSRPKLSDLYTLFQSKLLENHTLHSGRWLYSPYMPIYGFAVPYFSVIAQKTAPWMPKTFHAQFPVTVILRSDFVSWPKLCPPTPKSPASGERKRSQGSLPAILISNVSRWWSGYLAMGEGRSSPLPPLSRFGTLETKMAAP